MEHLQDAFDRLRFRSLLAAELGEMEGLEVHLPVFETEAKQRLRQRPDYEELIIDFFDDPRAIGPPVDHEMVSYVVDDVRVKERSGPIYRLKRLLDLRDFQGWIQVDLELKVDLFDVSGLTGCPLYEDLDFRLDFSPDGTEITVYYTFEEKHDFFVNLAKFNQLLSSALSAPDTIQEVREDIAKWEAYNRFKEQSR